MLENYYVKQKARNKNLTGPLQSILYSLAPDNSLFTKEQLVSQFKTFCQSKPQEVGFSKHSSDKDIFGAINTLEESGFFKFIQGTRLQRWLETF